MPKKTKVKKIFISQPMSGLTDEEIKKEREEVINYIYGLGYSPREIHILDSYCDESAPDNSISGLWYLGNSLQMLSFADLVIFAKGWEKARGCLIEFRCVKDYGISYICMD